MTIETIIVRYGVIAVFLGAGIEGETVVVLGGLLAHRGLIDPVAAAIAASAGSFVADQFFFLTGRHFRQAGWMQRLLVRPAFARAMQRFESHPTIFVLSFRFIYGLRTVSPAAVGTSNLSARRFVVLNLIAAGIWGTLFTSLGYVFGNAVEALFGRLRSVEHVAFVGIGLVLAGFAVVAAWRWWMARRLAAAGGKAVSSDSTD